MHIAPYQCPHLLDDSVPHSEHLGFMVTRCASRPTAAAAAVIAAACGAGHCCCVRRRGVPHQLSFAGARRVEQRLQHGVEGGGAGGALAHGADDLQLGMEGQMERL